MAIRPLSELPVEKRRIDLSGPEGNAVYLMGLASNLARQLDRDEKSILARMRFSDYEHLLAVFDEEFCDFVDLYR